MAIQFHALRFAQQFAPAAGDAGLHLVHLQGRAAQATLPAGWLTTGLQLSGHAELR